MKFNNINAKRLSALVLSGVMAFAGSPRIAKATTTLTPDEIVKMCEASVQRDLSYEEYCVLCYNVCEYLNTFGLDISIDEVYGIVYMANYAYIPECVKEKLISNGFISRDPETTMNYALSMCALIATYNGNVYTKTLQENTKLDRSKIIKVSELSINERDKYIADTFDSRMADYIYTRKTSCEIYSDLYNGYVKIPTETNFKLEQASIGFEKVVNLTCGAVFYSQITEMHAIDNSIVASEQDLRILSEHIHDIRNMQVALNQKKCLKK